MSKQPSRDTPDLLPTGLFYKRPPSFSNLQRSAQYNKCNTVRVSEKIWQRKKMGEVRYKGWKQQVTGASEGDEGTNEKRDRTGGVVEKKSGWGWWRRGVGIGGGTRSQVSEVVLARDPRVNVAFNREHGAGSTDRERMGFGVVDKCIAYSLCVLNVVPKPVGSPTLRAYARQTSF
ncbi:hypothetical protein M0804_004115 [Polistes exclamans]|nr:hypothetical protein M0804_004115 [Polistes exclamans]